MPTGAPDVDSIEGYVITGSEASWILPFTGPAPREFRTVIAALCRKGADEVRSPGASP